MAKEVLMPKLSSTMDIGYVTEWYVEEGDYVKVGDRLFEVMTDKIAIEVESYDEGYILKRYVELNETVPVNTVIAYIGEKDEIVPDQLELPEIEEEKEQEAFKETTSISSSITHADGRIRATPSARRLAREKNIDLATISGSGRGGRIQASDIQKAKNTPVPLKHQLEPEFISFKGMRKTIADNMLNSVSTKPHVSMFSRTDVTELFKLKDQIKANDVNVSVTDIVLYIVSRVLKKHPYVNSTSSKEGIYLHPYVNLGVAVALDNGLVVPVIKNADTMSLTEISKSRIELMNAALEGKISPNDMRDGTFTVSSIGRGKVEGFTPIINAPESGILGVGAIVDAYKLVNGEIIATKELTYSLSFDHGVLDGYPASLFLNELVTYTENPYLLFT